MNRTRIPWCDYTWNPIVGCSPASEGCANCYAAAINKRFHLPWGSPRVMPQRFEQPARLLRPSRIFVCSMSDFYHESVDDVTRSAVMDIIGQCQRHTFIILTKRPERIPMDAPWYPNVWLGVTAENQKRYDDRWETLLCMTTGSNPRPTVMFVSVEPMLGPVSTENWTWDALPDWVIAGPETGPKARPCEDAWINALGAESPCFFDKRKNGTRREFPGVRQ
jgi:protein gp37